MKTVKKLYYLRPIWPLHVCLREAVYFLSVLILLGVMVEALRPGLFMIYFSAPILAWSWLFSVLAYLYVRK